MTTWVLIGMAIGAIFVLAGWIISNIRPAPFQRPPEQRKTRDAS